jgi:hypothetical protein
MAFYSLSEILILLALTGLPVNDAASLIEPAGYLKAHDVELKAERLAELITRDAKDGKEQMIQLLAIRWLGLHPAEATKAQGALEALRAVAAEAKGRDAHRFARDHAARALARIEGKPAPPTWRMPADSVRADALSWFPAEATLVAAVDLRSASGDSPLDPEAVAAMIARLLPEQARKPIYEFVDTVGNLRLDRFAFALEVNEKQANTSRIWIRFTGAGDPKGLEAFLKTLYPERDERRGPLGERIVILTKKDSAPAFACIGKTDFVIAGYEGNKGAHIDVVNALLETRAGDAKSVVAGPKGEVLKKVGAKAGGVFLADLSESMRADVLRGLRGAPFKAIPGQVVAEAFGGKVLTARIQGTMKDEEEAAATAKGLEELKEQGLQALKNAPADFPKVLVEVGRKALEEAKIEAKGPVVTATAQIPSEALKGVLKAVEDLIGAAGRKPRE